MHSPDDEGSKVAERQAHRFAAAFLMPAADIRHELPAKAQWPLLVELKAKWQVSIAALLMRAKTLEVMAPNAYTQAYKFMSMRGWRTVEPGKLGAPESPILLRTAVDLDRPRATHSRQWSTMRVYPLMKFEPSSATPTSAREWLSNASGGAGFA